MPWCPKCKSEYREGFTVCVDCGSQLVEEEPVREQEVTGFWSDSTERSADIGFAQTQEQQTEEQIREAVAVHRTFRASSHYQDSSQRADENRSSAWILLAVGGLGLAFVILGFTGILPFSIGNPYLFYGVMGSVFILFAVTGVISMKNARFFAGKAESENSLRSTLLDWCSENLRAAEIDSEVGVEGVAEEVLYFSRTAYIKDKLNHQFVNLDQDFLDRFVDDHIYGMVFESEKV